MRLKGKIAIVTGGGSGIGRATAECFAREGARVLVADREPGAGEGTARAIRDAGGEVRFVEVDVSDPVRVQKMVEAALDAFGGIDILFNNAGVLAFGSVLDTDPETWHRVLAVNLTGVYLCSRAAIPHMVARGGGSIVNVSSSTGAYDAKGNTAAYVASKGGVTLLTKAMAIDHGRQGVRVNCICPGDTDTPLLREEARDRGMSWEDYVVGGSDRPLGRIGRSEEIASAALFLATDASSYMTGSTLVVDGGGTAG